MKVEKSLINIGTTPMGTNLDVIKYEMDSEVKGKTVYLQSGIHGGEITQWILHELFNYLKDNLKKGKVVLVPCANPVSWTQRAYFSTNGKFDFYMGKDWNRNFPGKEDGTLGERIANILISEAKKADFSIDLHTSRQSIPFTIFSKDDYIPFLKIMGIEHNQFIDMGASPSYKNTLNSNLDGLGVDNICIECGSHDAYEPKNVSDILLGIKRLLKSFDMVKECDFDENASKIKIFRKGVTYKANKGCLIRLAKELGEQVKKGDDLYYYYDNNDLGNIVAHKSEHNGILFKVSPTHIYWSGDDVLQLLLNDGVEEV